MHTYYVHVSEDLDKSKVKGIIKGLKIKGYLKNKYDKKHRWFLVSSKEATDKSDILVPFVWENVFSARVEEKK